MQNETLLNTSATKLSWQLGADTDSVRLLVSVAERYAPGTGILQGPYVYDVDVTGMVLLFIIT